MALIDWSNDLKDFCDTAALIANLDLVISVDTAVAHLAGALGKPVWMLLWYGGDWRWLQARNDSPWYPTMRLFRQAQLGDWTTPIARLRTALDEAARTFAETGRFINPPAAPAQVIRTPDATVEAAAEAAKNEGNVAYSNGDLEQAEQHYRRAVTLNPDYAEAHNNLALVLRAQQKYLAAEKHLLRAIAAKPELSNAYFNLGCLFVDTGRTTDAAVQFKKTLALDPDNANAHVELANLVGKQGQLDEAEQHLRKVLTLDPQSPQAYCNLASVFLSRGDTERAIDHARKSVEIDPAFAGGQNVLGAILLESGRLDLAAAALRQAIALAPDLKIAQYNLALCLMLMGNYDEGFALYESRDTTPRLAGVSENEHGKLMEIVSSISPWLGEPLEGRRLLIWQEQGFGDLLMMLRYLPLLLEKGVTEIILRCTPIQALARLVAAMPGGDRVQVIDLLAAVTPEVDFQCPQMSLPYLFGTRPETIPRNIPYLVVPDEIAKPWKVRLNNLSGLKVGLVWSGNSNNRSDAQRSITPALLAPLLAVAGVSFVSLQKLAKDSPMAIHDGALHDWMNECTDFLDTAALIENLDLVIAVDTAVAHLAGALGKPVWLLNRLNTDWRWFQDREDSPWYPTMRIFRQTRRGEWGEPIERIGVALDAVARTFDSTGSFINPSLLPST
jgi:tetratricopeptide (TPR) repeat protein